MVVIVIIGISAAVAMPKYSEAINKSQASEAPNIIGQIAAGEGVYQAEHSQYVTIAPDVVGFQTSLGVNTKSNYFLYAVTGLNNNNEFVAQAANSGAKNRIADGRIMIELNSDNERGPSPPSASTMRFVPAWR